MVTREQVEEFLKEEFEKRVRETHPPRNITFEQGPDGVYIQDMIKFLYKIFAQGAEAGAKLTIEQMLLQELSKQIREELKD